jgi:hypothetical protein
VHVRVVRFTDVDSGRMDALMSRIDQNDGPPEGVESSGIQILADENQGTAVVLQFFDSAEQMRSSEAVLDGMDSGETPGTRASVDRTELKKEMRA